MLNPAHDLLFKAMGQAPQAPPVAAGVWSEPSVTQHQQAQSSLQMQNVAALNPAGDLLSKVFMGSSPSFSSTAVGQLPVNGASAFFGAASSSAPPPTIAEAPSADGAQTTLYSYATMAQEAAQYAASAATLCGRSQDFEQAKSVAEAAEQAAGRARWALMAATEYESPLGPGDTMVESIRAITQQAFEQACLSAEKASQEASKKDPANRDKKGTDANDNKGVKRIRDGCQNFRDGRCSKGSECPYSHDVKEQQKLEPRRRTRVPCQHFKRGACTKGDHCPMSHDPADEDPLPMWDKRPFNCSYFQEGKCIRGQACAFAHGEEELDMVKKMKSAMRRSTMQPRLDLGSSQEPIQGGGVCWDHLDKGFCRYGSECRFKHAD